MISLIRGAILMNLNYLLQNRNELARKIFELQKEIKQAPPGDLICTQNSAYAKWYVSFGSTSKYIKRKIENMRKLLQIKSL